MTNETMPTPGRKTISVEEAGKLYFNLERNGSYAAATTPPSSK
jgi:hypothetical protein